jgi:hypothetical protein
MTETTEDQQARLHRIRVLIGVFVVGLVVSGVTAFPLGIEARALDRFLHGPAWLVARHLGFLVAWIDQVSVGLTAAYAHYPYLAYGTDWLAFAHLTIAVLFWGPYREPVRNIWVLKFGLIACAGVVPLALICAPLRHVPLWWTAVDSSFGVFGAVPLYFAYRLARGLEREALAASGSGAAPGTGGSGLVVQPGTA